MPVDFRYRSLRFPLMAAALLIILAACAPQEVEVTRVVKNTGVLEHNWALVSQDADPATVTDDDALVSTATGKVPPGGS